MAASVSASANPFVGGAQQRNLAPPGVGGAIGSANTRVSTPAAGVAPTQIKSARPNQGSNIGIPYSRLVPLNNSNKLIGRDESGKTVTRKETEDLRATSLAFILGIRGNTKPPRPLLAGNEQAPGIPGYNVAYQPTIMPAMVGTERFQQLCSLEYLHAYFARVLAGKVVSLDGMQNKPDLAYNRALADSEARRQAAVYQGIFTRDFGPFLKGKGGKTGLVTCTPNNLPYKDPATDKMVNPSAVSRNLGDDVAFERLEAALAKAGVTDWRPDGIVLSKGVNDPSDKLSDEYLEARDGQLYNLRVQGPAIGTTWTGERSMETLPMDKVFVVLIADVWFDREWGELTQAIAMQAMQNPDYVGAASVDYLMYSGYVTLAYLWARMAAKAQEQLAAGTGDEDFYKAKISTARFYMKRILPRAAGHKGAIEGGLDCLMELDQEHFAF